MDKPLLISIVLGYFLGSIPFTQIVAKSVKGIDLRQVGSKNVGGRNTAHNVGLGWGIFAGALDVLKGLAAMVCADKLGVPQAAQYWAGLAAIAGHNWPVWLGFRGGKGIAVTLGLLAWVAFPEALIVFFVGAILLRSTNN
ncbi:MAG: glycerol-3-phosphate acyltransferase, partial [Anaerolineae bacterium]|nr:glycerol-3-phosphate acyltransferase [Anaerolineae bacterium]